MSPSRNSVKRKNKTFHSVPFYTFALIFNHENVLSNTNQNKSKNLILYTFIFVRYNICQMCFYICQICFPQYHVLNLAFDNRGWPSFSLSKQWSDPKVKIRTRPLFGPRVQAVEPEQDNSLMIFQEPYDWVLRPKNDNTII